MRWLDTAGFEVAHFSTADRADIRTLKPNSISDVNNADNPLRVIPVHTVGAVHADALHHIYPHQCVTTISFHKAT